MLSLDKESQTLNEVMAYALKQINSRRETTTLAVVSNSGPRVNAMTNEKSEDRTDQIENSSDFTEEQYALIASILKGKSKGNAPFTGKCNYCGEMGGT